MLFLFRSEGVADADADALHGGAKMSLAPVPHLACGNFSQCFPNGIYGQLPDQRAEAQYHARESVPTLFARHMLQLADQRFQNFTRTEQPLITLSLLSLLRDLGQQILPQPLCRGRRVPATR